MQTYFTVVLQNGMHFSVIWLIIAVVLAAAAVLLWFYLRRLKRKALEQGDWDEGKRKAEERTQPLTVKDKYISKLQESRKKFEEGKISPRTAAQEISLTVRTFVFELTGRPAHRYTLRDIEKSRLKEIGKHVRLLYEPEFAPEDEKEETIQNLLLDAERIIKRW